MDSVEKNRLKEPERVLELIDKFARREEAEEERELT
jgi:hypothetical protein